MKAKDYLKQLKRLDTMISQKKQEVKDLHLIAESPKVIDYSKERVQTSRSCDAPFVHTVNRIMELNEEINQEIDKFVNERHKIINQIQSLTDIKYVEILFKKYVEYKSFDAIAAEMGYTYQYVIELHGCALQDFQRTYKILLKTYKPL